MDKQNKIKSIICSILSKTYFIKIIGILFLFNMFFVLLPEDIYTHQFLPVQTNPIAVMVGNSTDERKVQKGLEKANIVYEIEVEFPFTRLMAFYLEDTDTVIGPIRSSRYYFSRICAEWSAVFVHCGGQHLKNHSVTNIDQMLISSPFWRDQKIGGWINLFTSLSRVRATLKKLKMTPSVYHNNTDHSLFDQNNKINTNNKSDKKVTKITIKYHKDYIITYQYDFSKGKYNRFVNSKPHIDYNSGEQIKVSNILIQYVPVEKIEADPYGRVEVELMGEGIGNLFCDGIYQKIKWSKKTKDNQTLFQDKDNNLIRINQDKLWIHLLSPESEVWFKYHEQ